MRARTLPPLTLTALKLLGYSLAGSMLLRLTFLYLKGDLP